MRQLSGVALSAILLLCKLAASRELGGAESEHPFLGSNDVGVTKCTFEGNLGPSPVTLYIFLVACVPPYKAPPGSNASVNASPMSATRQSLLEQQEQLSISASGTNGYHAGSGSSSGGGGSTAGALPSAPLRPPQPNAYVSGFVFMHEADEPVLTTQLEQPAVTLLWAAGLPHYNELLGLLGPMWKDPEAVLNAEAPKDNDIDWGEDAKRKTRNKLAYIKLRRFLRGGGGAAWGPHKWELNGPRKKPSSAAARRDLKGWFGLDWGGQDKGGEIVQPAAQEEGQSGGKEPDGGGAGTRADRDGGSVANASSSGMERFVGRKGWEGWVVGGEQGGASRGGSGGAEGQQQGEEDAETEEERAQRLAKIQNRWAESFPEAEFIREHKPLVFARALTDAAALLERNGTMTVVQLRSPRTGRVYDLRLTYREPDRWRYNPSLRREPGRLYGKLLLDPGDLAALRGVGTDQPPTTNGQRLPVFQVRAYGFNGTCDFSPGYSGRRRVEVLASATPPLQQPSAWQDESDRGQGASQLVSAAAAASEPETGTRQLQQVQQQTLDDNVPPGGAPVCAWLRPERLLHQREVLAAWRERQRLARKARYQKFKPPPPPPPAPLAANGTGLLPGFNASARAVPTYIALSPFFNMSAYDYVTLLKRHVEYHAAMGVDRHIIYVEDGVEELAAEPRLGQLVRSGRVEVVAWREMPRVLRPGTSERHPYANQILTYNHALLALWHEAAVVAVADLDEFLVSSAAHSMEELLSECAARGDFPAAGLWIPRRNALCTPCIAQAAQAAREPMPSIFSPPSTLLSAAEVQIGKEWLVNASSIIERQMWLYTGDSASGLGDNARRKAHPLEGYRHWTEGWHHKSIVYSHQVESFGVHLAYTRGDPMGHTIAKLGCAVWLHLETQLGPKARGRAGEGGEEVSVEERAKEEERRRARAVASGTRHKFRVSAVEHRYYWAVEQLIRRPLVRVHHWGEMRGPGFE